MCFSAAAESTEKQVAPASQPMSTPNVSLIAGYINDLIQSGVKELIHLATTMQDYNRRWSADTGNSVNHGENSIDLLKLVLYSRSCIMSFILSIFQQHDDDFGRLSFVNLTMSLDRSLMCDDRQNWLESETSGVEIVLPANACDIIVPASIRDRRLQLLIESLFNVRVSSGDIWSVYWSVLFESYTV